MTTQTELEELERQLKEKENKEKLNKRAREIKEKLQEGTIKGKGGRWIRKGVKTVWDFF